MLFLNVEYMNQCYNTLTLDGLYVKVSFANFPEISKHNVTLFDIESQH